MSWIPVSVATHCATQYPCLLRHRSTESPEAWRSCNFWVASRPVPAYRFAPKGRAVGRGATMSISIFQASVPVFGQYLEALSAALGKASMHASAKKIDPLAYCQARLYPDMFPL